MVCIDSKNRTIDRRFDEHAPTLEECKVQVRIDLDSHYEIILRDYDYCLQPPIKGENMALIEKYLASRPGFGVHRVDPNGHWILYKHLGKELLFTIDPQVEGFPFLGPHSVSVFERVASLVEGDSSVDGA